MNSRPHAPSLTAQTSPAYPSKRARRDSDDGDSPPHPASPPAKSPTSTVSSFRNVSACNRCRSRKNKCDQKLPACTSCERAKVKCVGYDTILKQEVPRSYVYYLESRVSYLESQLQKANIEFAPAEIFDLKANGHRTHSPADGASQSQSISGDAPSSQPKSSEGLVRSQKDNDTEKLENLMSNIGMVSVQGASDPRYLGSTSGISFARVVFAAVKNSVSGSSSSERGGVRSSKTSGEATTSSSSSSETTTLRDSCFGLHAKPVFNKAPFPDRPLALKLVTLYFEHANPQIPILHRGEFMALFDRVYASQARKTPRELYMLNIVFAIGAGIYLRDADGDDGREQGRSSDPGNSRPSTQQGKRLNAHQHQPEEYHASAIVHLETFLGSSPASDRPDGFGGGLEELQAVLLLAGFALLRPVAPGLWYIIGVAVRLGIDLGLHYEDGIGIDTGRPTAGNNPAASDSAKDASQRQVSRKIDARERGRREWVRDLRRRLWWCVYSFDRLVSTCVGRPFGITDQVITTEFPSLLDDAYITPQGFLDPPQMDETPSYKHVSYHYFRLRLLQSEIMGVLQYQLAQQVRASRDDSRDEFIHTQLPSPYLQRFDSFRAWRKDVDQRLGEWRDSAPSKEETGVMFSHTFLELNYWQAVIMLYRQSLSVPATLAQELSSEDDVSSPSLVSLEDGDDEQEVFMKVAEAGQKVLQIYRQLHRVNLVNYTYLATHHLFMAGLSSEMSTLDEVDFTVLAAHSVLGDLMDKCPPAEACRDAFKRMSKVTIQMCQRTTGFGSQAGASLSKGHRRDLPNQVASAEGEFKERMGPAGAVNPTYGMPASMNRRQDQTSPSERSQRPPTRFDMNLGDLYAQEDLNARSMAEPGNDDMMTGFSNNDAATEMASRVRQSNQQSFNEPSQAQTGMHQQSLEPHIEGSPHSSGLTSFDLSVMDYMDAGSNQGEEFGSGQGGFGIGTGTGYGSGGAATSAGLDLGFGIAGLGDPMGEHDWSEGFGIDLFNGFYFGPGGGLGGMGGNDENEG
ncbi:MAG: hypothetical protein M4579_000811 [Chaenotheca gracillima]|nr:MAG: hypothetical protein M4579_000811 [Chaenotheca gracillima]